MQTPGETSNCPEDSLFGNNPFYCPTVNFTFLGDGLITLPEWRAATIAFLRSRLLSCYLGMMQTHPWVLPSTKLQKKFCIVDVVIRLAVLKIVQVGRVYLFFPHPFFFLNVGLLFLAKKYDILKSFVFSLSPEIYSFVYTSWWKITQLLFRPW